MAELTRAETVSISADAVNDLIRWQSHAIKLENLERENKTNWDRMQVAISETRSDINEIKRTLGNGQQYLNDCKVELEEKVKREYVTQPQLELALLRQSEALSKMMGERFDAFANRMEGGTKNIKEEISTLKKEVNEEIETLKKEVRQKHDLMTRILGIGSGIAIAASVIYAGIELFGVVSGLKH